MPLCVTACSECYAYRKGNASWPCSRAGGGRGRRLAARLESLMKRPVKGVETPPDEAEKIFGDFADKHPNMWAHLSHATWDDGGVRETSTLSVFVEEGLVKLCLNDRSAQRTGWYSARGWEAAFAGLEQQLAEERVEWRKSRPWSGKRR